MTTQPAGAAESTDPDDRERAIREGEGRPVPADMADRCAALVAAHLSKLRFGAIAITVHDGRIVQLDVTEKRRLAR